MAEGRERGTSVLVSPGWGGGGEMYPCPGCSEAGGGGRGTPVLATGERRWGGRYTPILAREREGEGAPATEIRYPSPSPW